MGGDLLERLDLLGAVVALVIYVSSIVTFSARIVFDLPPGHWIGIPFLLMAFLLGFLLYRAPSVDRPPLYYVQVGLMLASIVVLFLLDYVFGIDWRDTTWAVVSFVVLYFAGMGGMIGVASQAGQTWTISAVVLFLAAAVMAFVQRGVTGLRVVLNTQPRTRPYVLRFQGVIAADMGGGAWSTLGPAGSIRSGRGGRRTTLTG